MLDDLITAANLIEGEVEALQKSATLYYDEYNDSRRGNIRSGWATSLKLTASPATGTDWYLGEGAKGVKTALNRPKLFAPPPV